jgi:hypothetical protein
MRKLSLLLLIVACGSLVIVGSKASAELGGIITGKVNNTFHGGGIKGVKVSLTSEDGSDFVTATDSSGYFTFSDLPPGRYEIVLTKRGFFKKKVAGIKVEEGKETKVETGMLVAFGGT